MAMQRIHNGTLHPKHEIYKTFHCKKAIPSHKPLLSESTPMEGMSMNGDNSKLLVNV